MPTARLTSTKLFSMWFAILCLIILFFFIRPAYKVWKAVNAAQRQAREMNDAFRRAAGIDPDEERRQAAEQKRASRKGGWTTPAPKRKKIDPEVGEYIKFKEVDVETAGTSGSSADQDPDGSCHASADRRESARNVAAEQQVEDVKWEDVV